MEVRTLYRVSKNGKTTISPTMPTDGDFTETFRLIADEGKVLTDGIDTFICIDTDEPDVFSEVNEAEESEYAEAGRILLGVIE